MSQEIGTAYVTIQPSGRGFGKAVEGELGDSIDRGSKKGGKSFLAATGTWVKRAGVVGAGIAAAFTIKGGISRLMAIDDAEGKLRGLGFTTQEISTVMANALAAVKGTAFGLGDAATAAAAATAAGIKPGKALQKYLTLIGDAATIGGASFSEMGAIINKTTASGKVGMENLNQLTERGIPIMTWLAKEYGVSGAALTKMVSKGQVDAKTFRKAINDNIGGAALESGNTARGALANLGASLGRIGAGLTGGLFKGLGPAATNLTASLAPLEVQAGKIGEAIGEWARTDGASIFHSIVAAIKPLVPVFVDVVKAGAGIVKFFADHKTAAEALIITIIALTAVTKAHNAAMAVQAAGGLLAYIKNIRIVAAATRIWTAVQWALNLALSANPIVLIIVGLVALGVALYLLWTKSETFRAIVTGAFNAVVSAAQWVFNFIKDNWPLLLAILTGPIGLAVLFIVRHWDQIKSTTSGLVSAVIGFFGRLVSGIVSKVTTAVSFVAGLPGKILRALGNLGKLLYGAGKALIQGLIDGIKHMAGKVTGAVSGIASGIKGFFGGSPVEYGPLLGWNNGGAGKDLMGKLVAGIDASHPAVKAAMTSLTSGIADPASGFDPAAFGRGIAASDGGSKSVTWAPVINNPKPEKATDSMFQMAQKLAYLGLEGV